MTAKPGLLHPSGLSWPYPCQVRTARAPPRPLARLLKRESAATCAAGEVIVSEQPPPWDPFSRQDPRPGQSQGQYPPQQPPYGYQPPYGQPPRQPSFTPGPQYAPPPSGPPYQGHQAPQQHRGRSRAPRYAGQAVIVVAALICGGVAGYLLHGAPSPAAPAAMASSSPAVSQAAEPQTAAGVRATAQQFYALFAASQFAAAWGYLAPSDQAAIPRPTYVAVHDGCPSASAGLARVIKSVTVTGSIAVVTETVAGSLGNLGTVADTWTYAGGRWGYSYPPADMKVYSHGSAAADIAASKTAGDCG